MSRRVKKYKHHLKFLSVCDSKTCKDIIKSANGDLIEALCECAINVLNGNVTLNPAQKKRLSKHKNILRKLTVKGSIPKKRKTLQTGKGLLPVLLAPVLGALSSLLFRNGS